MSKETMALPRIKLQDTFLCDEVQNLVQTATPDLSQEQDSTNYEWINLENGILWEKLETIFSNTKGEDGSKAWFLEVIQQLSPLFGECYHMLMQLYPNIYNTSMKPLLEWTHQEEDICHCIKLISERSECGDHLVALLTITSLVERALGNVVAKKCKQVPFLLKDLLVTPELEEIIGKTKASIYNDVYWPCHTWPYLVQLLIVMVGSVLGLNLRNIAWHGFLSPHETSQSFIATIIFILIDCGRMLKNAKGMRNIPARPNISFEEAACLSNIFAEVNFPERHVLEELIKSSCLAPIVMYPAWIKALDLLEKKQWGSCITLLLPMLECSMRAMFSHVNKAPERLQAAGNVSRFTTMDDILNEYVGSNANKESKTPLQNCNETGEDNTNEEKGAESLQNKNQVQFAIGIRLNEALHDLLNFIQGPRVRDKVSHGEAKLHEIPTAITRHVLYLSLLVLSSDYPGCNEMSVSNINQMRQMSLNGSEQVTSKRDIEEQSHENTVETNNSLRQNCSQQDCSVNETYTHLDKQSFGNLSDITDQSQKVISKLRTCINHYQCVYHPSAILQSKLVHAISQLSEWKQWERVTCEELEYPEWASWDEIKLPGIMSYLPLQISHEVCRLHDMEHFLSFAKDIQYKVLYRPKQEIELVSILQRITACISTTIEMTSENMASKYSQYINKKLRSRQRGTYQKQLAAVPVIVLNCYLTSQVIYMIFLVINKSGDLNQSSFGILMRLLKSILKVIENLVSYTSLSINRWDEAASISMNNIDHINQNFT